VTTLPDSEQFKDWAHNNAPGKKGFQPKTTSSAPPSKAVDASAARSKVEGAVASPAYDYVRPAGTPDTETLSMDRGKPFKVLDWTTPVDRPAAKVEADEHFNTLTVQAGYYGSGAYLPKGGIQPTLDVGKTPGGAYLARPVRQPCWVVEFAGNRANAQRIARNDRAISSAVGKHGRTARVHVTFNPDGTANVREYDFGRWSETVPVVP